MKIRLEKEIVDCCHCPCCTVFLAGIENAYLCRIDNEGKYDVYPTDLRPCPIEVKQPRKKLRCPDKSKEQLVGYSFDVGV